MEARSNQQRKKKHLHTLCVNFHSPAVLSFYLNKLAFAVNNRREEMNRRAKDDENMFLQNSTLLANLGTAHTAFAGLKLYTILYM